MDKVAVEMTENGDLSAGSLYELNQQAYDQIPIMSRKNIEKQLTNLYEWIQEQKCDYTMLLCHERRDYTILHYNNRENETYKNGTLVDLKECINNRGRLLDVRYLQDQDAWEIWIRIFENKGHQNYMYMFFNAEGFVVEI